MDVRKAALSSKPRSAAAGRMAPTSTSLLWEILRWIKYCDFEPR